MNAPYDAELQMQRRHLAQLAAQGPYRIAAHYRKGFLSMEEAQQAFAIYLQTGAAVPQNAE